MAAADAVPGASDYDNTTCQNRPSERVFCPLSCHAAAETGRIARNSGTFAEPRYADTIRGFCLFWAYLGSTGVYRVRQETTRFLPRSLPYPAAPVC